VLHKQAFHGTPGVEIEHVSLVKLVSRSKNDNVLNIRTSQLTSWNAETLHDALINQGGASNHKGSNFETLCSSMPGEEIHISSAELLLRSLIADNEHQHKCCICGREDPHRLELPPKRAPRHRIP